MVRVVGRGALTYGVDMAIDPFFGSVLSGAASLVGGIMSGEGNRKANEQAMEQAAYNRQYQEQFAKLGVTWRAEDVMNAYKKTGIHPLALLGTSGATYSPVSVSPIGGSGVGSGLAAAGQDISRGLMAGADRELREKALGMQEALMNTNAERGQLENELLKVRIMSEQAKLRGQLGPPAATPGATEQEINFPGVEKKVIPDVTVVRTPRGGYVVLPSNDAQQRMEEIFGLGPEWWARNRAWLATEDARQWVKSYLPKPPANMEWRYHPPTGEWLPSYVDYPDRHMRSDVDRRTGERVRGLFEGGM